MASKKLSTDTSLANSYKLSRGVASVARPSAPTIGTATDGGSGNMSVTFTASTLGPTASSFTLTSSSGVTGSGASSPLTLQEVATGTYTYSVGGVNANGTGPSSVASNSVNVTNVFAPSGAYDSIATFAVASTTTSITFTSIPQTYTHLQIRAIFRNSAGATSTNDMKMQFNSDTGGNYSQHYIGGNGSSFFSGGQINYTYMPAQGILQEGNTANVYGASIIDILEYTNTSIYKSMKVLNGYDANGSGEVLMGSGTWRSTSAITSVTLGPSSGNLKQYSHLALYGIKGA